MLPPAELSLAARDGALPGLPLLLDAAGLSERLGLGPIRRPYLRYKPGTSCTLAFQAGDGDDLSAFAAMAHTPEHHAVVRARPQWGAGRVRFLDDRFAAVVPMALDRKLPALPRLSRPERRGDLLTRTGGPAFADAAIRLLRYNPNRRAVLRLDGPDGPLALAKAYSDADWPRVLEGARLAERHGGPRLLGASEERRLILSQWIEGRPLWSEEGGLAATAEIVATGAALARLHHGQASAARRIEAADEVEELAAAARALAALLPSLADRAQAIARSVASSLAQHERRPTLLHGDFSADQVVVGLAGPVLIDWDRAVVGDPARDLGSFLARLDAQVMDGDLSQQAAAQARHALLAGYGAGPGLPGGVRAQQARALFLLLPEAFRLRQAGWPERATAILARVEALLPAPGQAKGSGLDGLAAQAGDLTAMRPILAAATGLPPDAIEEVTLLRRKPDRRALLRYALREGAGPSALLGKLRAKGPDRHTPALHADLRGNGLDGRAPYRVGVPRPLGEVRALHLWFQEEVPGRRLTDLLRPGSTGATRPVGGALARLHASPVEPPRRWTLEETAAASPRVGALADASAELAAALEPGAEAVIHRDWYPDQALVDGDRVWIVDLDLCARGDPAIDLGNFLAHVTELALRRHGDPAALEDHERAFIEGYAAAGGAVPEERVAAMKALSLARLVAISRRLPDRQDATGAILDLAERLVADALQQTKTPPRLPGGPAPAGLGLP